MAITLYDLAGAEDDRRFSPYCWRIRMALKHKGLEFETVPWRFTEKEAIAPHGSSTEPLRPVLAQNRCLAGHGPGFADYILFGTFQWARVVSPIRLLELDDPLYAWRERMLDLFGGYARQARGYEG